LAVRFKNGPRPLATRATQKDQLKRKADSEKPFAVISVGGHQSKSHSFSIAQTTVRSVFTRLFFKAQSFAGQGRNHDIGGNISFDVGFTPDGGH
jgi:hypothetical protein